VRVETTGAMVGQVRTVQLGQFTDENADKVAEALEHAGIAWWFKQSGRWGRTLFLGEWGTRLFVDASRLEEAREVARAVLGSDDALS
jgi:uncharacterized LabA/DUF88 family protein